MQKNIILTFGEVLKTYRKQKQINQYQLAQLLDVHLNTISAWERGEYLPKSKGIVLEIANQLHLNPQATVHLLEASLTALSPYWSVPYQRNPFFTGHSTFLQVLHNQLRSEQTIGLSQSYALSGLGGIGKTQLALEYAYQYALDYHAIFWIGAETIDTLFSGFATIAEQVQLPEHKKKDHLLMVKAVLHWLSTHKSWLIIFDNVEVLSHLKPFLPSARQGAILITTRLHTLEGLAPTIEVPPLSHEEGVQFLLRRANLIDPLCFPEQLPSYLMESASILTEAMGSHPLALDQAGAYIDKYKCDLTDYLHLYQIYQTELLDTRSTITNHPDSVVKTFLLSLEKVAQTNAAAADLLRICAFLQPDTIPEEIFCEGAQHLGPYLQTIADDPLTFNNALNVLLSSSLIHRNSAKHLLSIHPLLQTVIKEKMDEATQQLWKERIMCAIKIVLPRMEHIDRERYSYCLSNAQKMHADHESLQLTSSNMIHFLK